MRNKNRILPILLSLFSLSVFNAAAQKNPYNEVSISSPNAASLGKYADIPVNYHTGIPQISIPIYTIKEGPLSLPISLSYHASGLKVMETASWVGAGWSLNAGGVITRTVQGAPDEEQTSSVYNQTDGHLSKGGYNNYLWVPGGAPQPPPSLTWAPQNQMQDWGYFAEGKKDGEPDLFFFNFAGYSGKFYFHDDGAAVLVPEQDLKIEYSYTPGVGKSIESFTMTTPEGTKYYFGKTASTTDTDPIEKTNPFTVDAGLTTGTAVSGWYLNKITSVDDLFNITLLYTPENYSYYTVSLFPVKYDTALAGHKPIKNMMSAVRLTNILFTNGKIDFIPATTNRLDLNGSINSFIDDANTEAKALASIQISNAGTTVCKKFDFSYSYFEDNTSAVPPGLISSVTTDRKRLKLNTLQESSCDGTVIIPPHQFDYFTELVPRRFSFAQDHWGFINDATGNTSLIPTLFPNSFEPQYGANRDASWPAMRGGSLKKITYPTGGYTDLEFEPNYTWVNYNRSSWVFRFSQSAGYDGSSLPVTQYQPFTNNSYRINFTNSTAGSQAFLRIYNSSNVEVKGYVLESGQSFIDIVQFPAGTYRIVMQKLAAVSGQGSEADFEEWTAANIQKNETVGGLRIKKMTVHDGVLSANDIVTNYSYEFGGHSTGILYSRPAYAFAIRNDIWRDIGFPDGPTCSAQGCITCDGGGLFYYKSPSGIRPMETTQGNHIGYSEVKVSKSGNGYSVYRYYGSNLWDLNTSDVSIREIEAACVSTIANFPFAPFPHEFMRGELKFEGHQNEAGQTLRDAFYYPVYQNNPKTTPAFIAVFIPNAPPESSPGELATFYTLSTAKKIQTGVVETTYNPGVASVTTSRYTYFESPYHNQATRSSTTSSTGQTIESKIKYAADFRISTCDAISDCSSAYATAASSALSTFLSRKGGCADHNCRWWAWQAYIKELSVARSTYVTCRKTNYTGIPTNGFKTCLTDKKNTASDAWLKPVVELQLKFNNPSIETTSWRNAKLLAASFSKFDYATIPSTQVYLNKVLSIDIASPSTTFTAATPNTNTITKDSRYKDEATVKFYNGNLVEVTPKAGTTTSYIWGYGNVLPIVKAVGVDHTTLKTAYDAVAGNLSVLRNQSSLNSAFVNTYAYDPFIGITQETNPDSRNIFYEYDKLQRLVLVRDHDNNILKKICYGYAGQSGSCGGYSNTEKSGVFTRNNCQPGYTGSQVTYVVPGGTYTSSVSVEDANITAQNDVNANGQNYANTNGICNPPLVTVQGYNNKSSTYQVRFINNATAVQYTFYLTASTPTTYTLGQVPSGIYAVQFSLYSGSPQTATFNINNFTQSGTSANFSNISIMSTSTASMY